MSSTPRVLPAFLASSAVCSFSSFSSSLKRTNPNAHKRKKKIPENTQTNNIPSSATSEQNVKELSRDPVKELPQLMEFSSPVRSSPPQPSEQSKQLTNSLLFPLSPSDSSDSASCVDSDRRRKMKLEELFGPIIGQFGVQLKTEKIPPKQIKTKKLCRKWEQIDLHGETNIDLAVDEEGEQKKRRQNNQQKMNKLRSALDHSSDDHEPGSQSNLSVPPDSLNLSLELDDQSSLNCLQRLEEMEKQLKCFDEAVEKRANSKKRNYERKKYEEMMEQAWKNKEQESQKEETEEKTESNSSDQSEFIETCQPIMSVPNWRQRKKKGTVEVCLSLDIDADSK
jgi:hypothetical protein